jgi:hypothetical protein
VTASDIGWAVKNSDNPFAKMQASDAKRIRCICAEKYGAKVSEG